MGVFDKIFGSAVKETVGSIGTLIDGISTSDDEKSTAKAELTEIVTSALGTVVDAQKEVLQTEMRGNWLQRSWRPLVMLSFAIIMIAKWFGLTEDSITEVLELKLMSIVELGLGGYVIGRSVEQVADKVTKNIDIPFLKKKDRK